MFYQRIIKSFLAICICIVGWNVRSHINSPVAANNVFLVDKQFVISEIHWLKSANILKYSIALPYTSELVDSTFYPNPKTLFRGDWPDNGLVSLLTSQESSKLKVDKNRATYFSPNGRYVLYTSLINGNLYFVNRISGTATDLGFQKGIDSSIIWNRSGSTFLLLDNSYTYIPAVFSLNEDSPTRIYDAAKSHVDFLENPEWPLQSNPLPSISDDGKYVAAVVYVAPQASYQLAILNIQSPDKSYLLDKQLVAPIPTIMFESNKANSVVVMSGNQIVQYNVLTGQKTYTLDLTSDMIDNATLSADGRWLAYTETVVMPEATYVHLYSLDLDQALNIPQSQSPILKQLTLSFTCRQGGTLKWNIYNSNPIDLSFVWVTDGMFQRGGGVLKANTSTLFTTTVTPDFINKVRIFVGGEFQVEKVSQNVLCVQ